MVKGGNAVMIVKRAKRDVMRNDLVDTFKAVY
jgi:hypothetical protein